VSRAIASTTVPGRVADAEALWYDPHRWAAWIDGFGHVMRLEGEWPGVGSRLLWSSPPSGRGLVSERMTAYEPRRGCTLDVEDARLAGTQWVTFEPEDGDRVRVTLGLDYELKEPGPFSALIEPLFIRRAQRDSLRRTLARFAHERRAETQPF
jgi:hypothetical protein